jgi:hypothetical protein
VRPSDAGWKRIARRSVPGAPGDSLGLALVDWIAGLGLVFGTLFGIGKFILGEPAAGGACLTLAIVCGGVIARNLRFAGTPTTTPRGRPGTSSAAEGPV